MYRFFSGVPRMDGISVARRGVVGAAAALAAAATSMCLTDRLHPLVPIGMYTASPSLLSCASSSSRALNSSLPSFTRGLCLVREQFSSDLRSISSLPSAETGVNSIVLVGSVKMASHWSPFTRIYSTSCTTGSSSPLLSSSPFRPYLYSLEFSRDDVDSQFRACTTKTLPNSSLVEFRSLRCATAASWSVNSPSFDTFDIFDLSFHLASFFSLPAALQSQAPPAAITSRNLHRWHEPKISVPAIPKDEHAKSYSCKPVLTVVLLGWLGSQQKHLEKYADWYNARGINAVTFTLPMADIVSLSMGAKAEEHVENLTSQLSTWLVEETEKDKAAERQLIFHTFSNTGWLTYGVVLEKLSSRGNLVDRIKGCVVDSAPAADLDPRVWAGGFSAALLKKRTIVTNGGNLQDSGIADSRHPVLVEKSKPHVAESALLALLEKFFEVFLQIPSISNRLGQVVTFLSKEQPPCPQLYIYSTADKVIPASMVESFMEKQRQQGRNVRGCNFQSSPHVDHFRSFPEIYSSQISTFLEECLNESFSKGI